jgi:hypothetical protein
MKTPRFCGRCGAPLAGRPDADAKGSRCPKCGADTRPFARQVWSALLWPLHRSFRAAMVEFFILVLLSPLALLGVVFFWWLLLIPLMLGVAYPIGRVLAAMALVIRISAQGETDLPDVFVLEREVLAGPGVIWYILLYLVPLLVLGLLLCFAPREGVPFIVVFLVIVISARFLHPMVLLVRPRDEGAENGEPWVFRVGRGIRRHLGPYSLLCLVLLACSALYVAPGVALLYLGIRLLRELSGGWGVALGLSCGAGTALLLYLGAFAKARAIGLFAWHHRATLEAVGLLRAKT